MEELLNNIAKTPTSQKILVTILAIIGIVGGYWYLSYQDQVRAIQGQKRIHAELQRELIQKREIAKNLVRFQREVASLEVQLKQAKTLLPDSSDIPELLRKIHELAEKSGLQIREFKPLAARPKGFYAEVPVEMKLTGAYTEIATFFHKIGQLPRIVNITGIQMGKARENKEKSVVDTSCMATTFRSLSEAEQSSASQTAARRRRPGRR